MKYIIFIVNDPNQVLTLPNCVYAEVDDDGYEVRRIEYYPDGKKECFSEGGIYSNDNLAEVPWGNLSDFNRENAIYNETEESSIAVEITKSHFEQLWPLSPPQ